MVEYDKSVNAIVLAGIGPRKVDTGFRVVHRGVLQSTEYATAEDAHRRLTELIVNRSRHTYFATWFVAGTWTHRAVNSGGHLVEMNNGSHAGVQRVKAFNSLEEKSQWLRRMGQIYGSRMNVLGADDRWRNHL